MNLKLYYQNVRGLKTKTDKFRTNIITNSYDVILLCETWLIFSLFSSELFDDRYIVYRKDRDNVSIGKKDGGGCVIAVKKTLFSKSIHDWELNNDIWVSVDHLNGEKTFFNVKYIELGTKLDAYRLHFDKITEIYMSSNTRNNFILTGDYNLARGFMTRARWRHRTLRVISLMSFWICYLYVTLIN